MKRRDVLVLLGLTGCIYPTGIDGGEDGGAGHSSVDADMAEYRGLAHELDQHRSEFLGEGAGELTAAGNTLYWLDFGAWAPTLHSASGTTATDYAFSIGEGNTYNVRVSSEAVATAALEGGDIVYRLYASGAPSTLLGETTFPSPSDEQRWWAYAVDGTSLYVLTTGEVTTLHRFQPGASEPTVVTTLQSAGCEVGELWDFGLEDGIMVFVESGRLWRLDVAANTCTFMNNETEISGSVDFRPDGIVYEAYEGLFFRSLTDGTTRDLIADIAASPYRLNETYAHSHYWAYDFARYQGWLVYVGSSGVFAYDLASGNVAPILLHPIDDEVRISYRHPVVLEDGTLFVTGLTSTSGSVGADGPVYRVDLHDVL